MNNVPYIENSLILGTCVSIIISTLALTVPFLLNMVSRINTQYNSVVLIDFFREERRFKFFKCMLTAAIVFLFVWIITNFCQYDCIYEICSCLLYLITLLLVISLTLLIKLCVNYNSPSSLFMQISKTKLKKCRKREVESFIYTSKDTEKRYIDAYISLFKYATHNDDALANRIAAHMSTIFNSYRNTYYEYFYPKTNIRFIKYPPSYYNMINVLNAWLMEETHEKIYSPYLVLTWLYDTNEHQTYLSKQTISCWWNNLILFIQNDKYSQLKKFVHFLFQWSHKWSNLYDNNKYDYKLNQQYKKECDSIRVIMYVLQTYLLMCDKEDVLNNLRKDYSNNDTLGKYSKIFFPKSLEDLLEAYSLLMTIISTNKEIINIFIAEDFFNNQPHLLKELKKFFAHTFCTLFNNFNVSHVEELKFNMPLFISFPRGSIHTYLNELKNLIKEQCNYKQLDTLFEELAKSIDKSNVNLISKAAINRNMLLDYYSSIQGSVTQLYKNIKQYCDSKYRANKTYEVQMSLLSRKDSKRYFIDLDDIAGNAYFKEFASRLRTQMENKVFESIMKNISDDHTYFAQKTQIATSILKIMKENNIRKNDIIVINAFMDLSKIDGIQQIRPKRTNKIIKRDKYRIDTINIIDIPISQQFREGKKKSIYILRRKESPYMQIYKPFVSEKELTGWICADNKLQVYLKLGKVYDDSKGNLQVDMQMKVGVKFKIFPKAEIWRIILDEEHS